MHSAPLERHWIPERVAKFMGDKGIRDRGALVKQNIGVSQTTIYRTFAGDWSGPVSLQVAIAISQWSRLPLAKVFANLVDDPVRRR